MHQSCVTFQATKLCLPRDVYLLLRVPPTRYLLGNFSQGALIPLKSVFHCSHLLPPYFSGWPFSNFFFNFGLFPSLLTDCKRPDGFYFFSFLQGSFPFHTMASQTSNQKQCLGNCSAKSTPCLLHLYVAQMAFWTHNLGALQWGGGGGLGAVFFYLNHKMADLPLSLGVQTINGQLPMAEEVLCVFTQETVRLRFWPDISTSIRSILNQWRRYSEDRIQTASYSRHVAEIWIICNWSTKPQ